MAKESIVILGVGLAGLSTAYHLEKLGEDYLIFEKEKGAGGLCRSKKIDGFTFDCDGHLLHFKHKDVFNLIQDLLKDNLIQHKRNAWVYSFDRYTTYPFQANLYGLPVSVVRECLLGFINSNDGHPKKNDLCFLEWINKTFGEGIAKYFMIPYNRKFWRASLDKLSCEWIDGYIPVPTLEELIEGTLKQSKIRFGYNSSFWYPGKGGIQELASAFARRIKNIFSSYEAVKINIKDRKIYFGNGKVVHFDKLISTLPLVELANICVDLPKDIISSAKKLKWISIFNLNLGINKPHISDKHWIYLPEKKYTFYRIGFPHNFSKSSVPPGKSSLYAEVSYLPSKRIDRNKLTVRIIEDLIKARIVSKKDEILVKDINNIKYGYVIYDRNHYISREILRFLASYGISSIGRFGSWKYMTMEEAILEGRETAKKIIKTS